MSDTTAQGFVCNCGAFVPAGRAHTCAVPTTMSTGATVPPLPTATFTFNIPALIRERDTAIARAQRLADALRQIVATPCTYACERGECEREMIASEALNGVTER